MIRIATEADAQAIADIFNESIDERAFAHSDLRRDSARARAKSLANGSHRHPTFVHVNANNEIMGWCALQPLSARPSWPDVSEISLYVRSSARNRVVGAHLLVALLDAARVRKFSSLIAVVIAKNNPSLRGLGIAGFDEVARLREAAYLHGQWLDILWLQKSLDVVDGQSVAHYAARFRTPAVDPLLR
jgi:L-amino acid N-acyltransferase YncA